MSKENNINTCLTHEEAHNAMHQAAIVQGTTNKAMEKIIQQGTIISNAVRVIMQEVNNINSEVEKFSIFLNEAVYKKGGE